MSPLIGYAGVRENRSVLGGDFVLTCGMRTEAREACQVESDAGESRCDMDDVESLQTVDFHDEYEVVGFAPR